MAKTRYTLDDWNAVRERLRLGDTVRGAAEACGVNRGAVLRWSHMGEPPDWMVAPMGYEVDPEGPAPAGRSAGQRLSFEDRAYIAAMSSQGCGPAEIALKVGVHRTTVARELARCAEGAYDPREAHLDARRRAR
ncbi:helix-turn-helix domain-containing protein, partial [Gordonibacter sp. RACS_AR68]